MKKIILLLMFVLVLSVDSHGVGDVADSDQINEYCKRDNACWVIVRS